MTDDERQELQSKIDLMRGLREEYAILNGLAGRFACPKATTTTASPPVRCTIVRYSLDGGVTVGFEPDPRVRGTVP